MQNSGACSNRPDCATSPSRAYAFKWRLPEADALWEACMGCMARIREAFKRHANHYLSAGGLELPMAFKVCAGRK